MSTNILEKIKFECGDFFHSSSGFPLIKTLWNNPSNFKKVKVRTKTIKNSFIEAFNEAFEEDYRNIHGRSIFCNGNHAVAKEGEEKFYVLPINGYKYLYNPNITFIEEYKKIYEKLSSSMHELHAEELFVDMIEYSYKNCEISFKNALFSQKEIIIYGIPYYYAVKVEKFPVYEDLLTILKS